VIRLGSGLRAALFLRSFAVQGSWNYRTLIGPGFIFALLPALRVIHRGDPAGLARAVDRHRGLFNSHPYLAGMAVGAVATMEAAGEDPAVIERFKTAVRGSLGTMGDRLIWAGWRPVCLLFSLAVLLLGGAWWAVVAAFLGVYNAGHLLLRAWALRVGLREGKRVGERLRRSPVLQTQRILTIVGAFLIGLVLPFAAAGDYLASAGGSAARVGLQPWWPLLAAAGAAAGLRWGATVRAPVTIALTAFVLIGLTLGILT
jgi:mannose PTS system EIID component